MTPISLNEFCQFCCSFAFAYFAITSLPYQCGNLIECCLECFHLLFVVCQVGFHYFACALCCGHSTFKCGIPCTWNYSRKQYILRNQLNTSAGFWFWKSYRNFRSRSGLRFKFRSRSGHCFFISINLTIPHHRKEYALKYDWFITQILSSE